MSTRWHRVKARIGRAWGWVVDTGLVLWITRVSFVSMLAGFALFLLVPQARDAFLEVKGSSLLSLSNWVFWLIFFIFVFLFWVLPVHYCARRDITFDPINMDPERALPQERKRRVDIVSEWAPRVIGAACLLAVALGAFIASAGLRDPTEAGLALYDQTHIQSSALGVVALVLVGGVFLFLMHRDKIAKSIEAQMGQRWLQLNTNFGRFVLTALTLLFFGLLILPISLVANFSRAPLIPLLLGGWVPPLAWLAYKGRVYRAPFIVALIVGLELLTVFGNNHDVRELAIDSHAQPVVDSKGNVLTKTNSVHGAVRKSLDKKIEEWKKKVGCDQKEGRSEPCPVHPIVVAASGGASRAGFFTAAVLGELTDLTSAKPNSYRDFREQLFAISSVSGSSTGAAFFVAAILDSKDGGPPCGQDKRSPLVHFSRPAGTWRECMETLLSGDFLSSTLFAYLYKDALRGIASLASDFGYETPDRAVILEESWEKHYCQYTDVDCEKSMSGLSRPFLQIYGVEQQGKKIPRELLPDKVVVPKKDSQWVPLLFLNSTDVDTGRRVIISPVEPSVCSRFDPSARCEPTERVFRDAYDLHKLMADSPGHEGRDISKHGFSFDALDTEESYVLREDILLSTAAGLSARFPFISPPGNVKNRDGNLVARLVDGGYFENFGAATASEIAKRLRVAGLEPVIIEITNDPELLGPIRVKPKDNVPMESRCVFQANDPVCATEPPVIEASDSYLFSGVRGPLSGLFGARAAQGGRALLQLANSENIDGTKRNGCPPQQAKGRFIHYFVEPQYTYSDGMCEMVDVSMSWWLSKPVQAYLDAQITDRNNMTRATSFMEYGRQTAAQ